MANLLDRVPRNVAGAYYVDTSCIDCDLCRSVAPQLFDRDPDSGFSFVHRQPANPEETALAEQALSDCPCDSIGRDGERN
jgi:ferredoxin